LCIQDILDVFFDYSCIAGNTLALWLGEERRSGFGVPFARPGEWTVDFENIIGCCIRGKALVDNRSLIDSAECSLALSIGQFDKHVAKLRIPSYKRGRLFCSVGWFKTLYAATVRKCCCRIASLSVIKVIAGLLGSNCGASSALFVYRTKIRLQTSILAACCEGSRKSHQLYRIIRSSTLLARSRIEKRHVL